MQMHKRSFLIGEFLVRGEVDRELCEVRSSKTWLVWDLRNIQGKLRQ